MKSQDKNKINRREAIKRMGMTVAGAAFMLSGMPTLSSCDNKEKKRIVFYFTATGNCLYVARHLSENLISIPQAFKQDKLSYEADEIGIVLPTYEGAPPEMVKKFLKKATLKADYLFAVITYGVNHTSVVDEFQKTAAKGGKKFNYVRTITMVDNYLPGFDMNEQKKGRSDENGKKVDEKGLIANIKSEIDSQKKWIEPVSDDDRNLRVWALENLGQLLPAKCEDLFVVTGACVSCGFCERVCPRGNYSIANGIATCKGDCEFCLACAQNCPQKAITLAAGEKNPKARYRHPGIALADIVMANNQMRI